MSVAGYFGDGRTRVDLKKELDAALHRTRDTERPTTPSKECYRHVTDYDAVLRAHVGVEKVDRERG